MTEHCANFPLSLQTTLGQYLEIGHDHMIHHAQPSYLFHSVLHNSSTVCSFIKPLRRTRWSLHIDRPQFVSSPLKESYSHGARSWPHVVLTDQPITAHNRAFLSVACWVKLYCSVCPFLLVISNYFKVHFNIILPSTPSYSKPRLSFRL